MFHRNTVFIFRAYTNISGKHIASISRNDTNISKEHIASIIRNEDGGNKFL
jgi:hypothetical protein